MGSVMSKKRGTIVSFFNGGKQPPNKKQKVAVKMSEPAVSDGECKQISRSLGAHFVHRILTILPY